MNTNQVAITHLHPHASILTNSLVWIQIFVFLTVFMLLLIPIMKLPRRRSLDKILTSRDEQPIEHVRTTERPSLFERMLPVVRKVNSSKMMRNRTGNKNTSDVTSLMVYADGFYNMGPDEFGVLRLILAIVFGGILFLLYLMKPGMMYLILAIMGALFGYYFPFLALRQSAQQRQNRINKQVLDMCALMKVAIQAGNTPVTALGHCVENIDGDLGDELGKTYKEIQVGTPRMEAFNHLTERCNVRDLETFVQLMNMQEQYGATGESLVQTLETIIDTIRGERERKQEASAQKAVLKLLIPTVLFLLPPLFLFVMGPAAVNMLVSMGI